MDIKYVAKNAGALTAASMLGRVINAVLFIFVARYLGVEAYGQYGIAYACVNLFSYFSELGLSQLMVQEASRQERVLPKYFGNALLVKGVAVIFLFGLMMLALGPLGYESTVRTMIVILGLGMAFNNLNQTVYNYYQARQKMAQAAGYQFLNTILIALLTIGVMLAGRGVIAITATHLASYLVISVLLFAAVRRQIQPQTDRRALPGMIKAGMPFGVHRMIYNSFSQVSVFILSLSVLGVSDLEIGLFKSSHNLIIILIALPISLASTLYPILYQLGENDTGRHQQAIEKMIKILAAVGIPASIFLALQAEPLIIWLFSEKYAAAAPLLVVLSGCFALECLSFPLGDILTTTNRQWQRALIQGAGLLLLIASTWGAEVRFGLIGAAWAVLVVEAFLFLGYYGLVRLTIYPVRVWRQLPTIILASLVMVPVALFGRAWHPLAAAGAAMTVYLIVLFLLDGECRFVARKLLQRS